MKKELMLITLLCVTTVLQAQMLKGTVTAPDKPGMASSVAVDMDRRTIDGVSLPTGKLSARRVSSVTPSGLIYGTRTYSNVWSDYYHAGIYVLNTSIPEFFPIYLGEMFNTTRGVCYIDGRLWLSHVERGLSFGDDNSIVSSPRVQHYLFNIMTGELEMYINPGYPSSSGWSMVYDRYTGIIYGNFSNNNLNKDIFGTLDLTTGRTTGIAEMDVSLTGMVIDKQHHMWGINRKTGILYEVNMTDGTLREVGNTGVTSAYANSGCLDPITGVYYYNTCNMYESSLYAIDTETATATHIYTFPNNDEWGAMWMLPRLSDAVPAAPKNVQATFDGLEGFVSFTMPNTLANGQMEMGKATYTVYVDGVATATGEAMYGSKVNVDLTMEHGGQVVVAVALSNDQGESDVVRQTATVGDAAVPAPATVTLAKSGNNFRVTWDAVDVSGVTYSVTRYPDAVDVATGLTTTTFTEPIPNGGRTNYFYSVTAYLGNAQSKPTRSNYLAAGQFTLPYSNHFETEDRAKELTYINANNDTYEWTYAVNCNLRGEHGIYVPKNNRELTFWEQMQGVVPETDDWAITPGLMLEGGKSYTVTYRVFSMYEYSNYTERYEVKMGTSPTVAAMTTQIKGPTIVLTGNYAPREDCTVFTAPADGVYYIGLHGISQGGFWFGCLGIDVSEGYNPNAPYFPMELTVNPDPDGELQASVVLRTSGWNTQRKALDGYDRIELLANDQLVYTWQNPPLRETCTATIELPRDGSYTIEAVPYGLTGGRGIPLKTTAYIGVRPPADVTGVTIDPTNTPGEVTMTWNPVTTNIDGATIDGSKVTYNVYNADEQLMGEELTATQHTFQAMDYDHDPQQFLRFYVTSHFNTFYSAWAGYTPYLLMGKPYQLPFYETTTTGDTRYAWLNSGTVSWDLAASSEDLASSDNDGTFLVMIGSEADQSGTYTSGKIHISGDNPKLTFDYAVLQGCNNTLVAKVICDGVTTTLGSHSMNGSSSDYVWNSVEYDLSAYAGKDIQLEFTGTVVTHVAVAIDNIKVTSTPTGIVGDVDGDGKVDVTDVNAAINIILELKTQDDYQGNADLDGDGKVDVSDVNQIINIILTQ
ncbi:MAG: dockerin type I repeat-containing protein [Muribaculaceae bacterium]|nr:dockerin type I repeat-containing protein [Muribaculaceae bacterium]